MKLQNQFILQAQYREYCQTKNEKGSGTPLVRLYKDNAYILGQLPQSAHLTNFGGL